MVRVLCSVFNLFFFLKMIFFLVGLAVGLVDTIDEICRLDISCSCFGDERLGSFCNFLLFGVVLNVLNCFDRQ